MTAATINPSSLAALPPLSENSHPGFEPSLRTMHPAPTFSKPLTASGLSTCYYDFRVGPRCTGKERDAETGLDFFESRYFSSAQGRFTSPDELFVGWDQHDPQMWNLYAYGRNNPLRFIDPDGHGPCVNGINPETGAFCVDVFLKPQPKVVYVPRSDDRLDSPLFYAVATGVQRAKPGVDLAGAGLFTFFSLATPLPMAVAQCGSGNCDKTNLAVAVIPEGSVGAKLTRWGWTGTKKFLAAVRQLKKPGTHNAVEGVVPTLEEAKELIQHAGGKIDRIDDVGHAAGGVSDHTYPHINYTTPSGSKATVEIGGGK